MGWTEREAHGESFDGLRVEAGTVFERCHFSKCTFRSARLSELESTGSTFDECDFSGANLSSSKHRGSSFLNCDFSGADLFGAQLQSCRMVGSVFAETVLTASTIVGGDWSYVSLRMQELAGFDLHEVKLEGADLYAADLSGAILRGAVLTKANLAEAKLRKADLRGAEIAGIDFKNVDVKGARLNVEQALVFAMSFGIEIE